MKLILLYFIFPLITWQTCTLNNAGIVNQINSIELKKDTIDFISLVQPILLKKCSPCHFTGGKMYERMPFDQDSTIINHEEGVLKRFKSEENLLIKNFIQQNKNGLPADKPQ